MATIKDEYSKWYYENYTKKGKKKGRDSGKSLGGGSASSNKRGGQVNAGAKTNGKTQTKVSGGKTQYSNQTENLSIRNLPDDKKAELKEYQAQLVEEKNEQRQLLDSQYKEMQAKTKSDIAKVKATVEVEKAKKEEAQKKRLEDFNKAMNEYAIKLAGMTPREKMLHKREIESELNAIRNQYRTDVEMINNQYKEFQASAKQQIQGIRDTHNENKTLNRSMKQYISEQAREKYNTKLRQLLGLEKKKIVGSGSLKSKGKASPTRNTMSASVALSGKRKLVRNG